jgi:hypothetical protein
MTKKCQETRGVMPDAGHDHGNAAASAAQDLVAEPLLVHPGIAAGAQRSAAGDDGFIGVDCELAQIGKRPIIDPRPVQFDAGQLRPPRSDHAQAVAARVFMHLGQGDPRQHEPEIDSVDIRAARNLRAPARGAGNPAAAIGMRGLVDAPSQRHSCHAVCETPHEYPPSRLVRRTGHSVRRSVSIAAPS